MSGRASLAAQLTGRVMLAMAVIWVLALLSTAMALRSEQEEVLNAALAETARNFLPVLSRDLDRRLAEGQSLPVELAPGAEAAAPLDSKKGREALIYQLVDGMGTVLMRSAEPQGTELPKGAVKPGITRSATHVFHVTPPDAQGRMLRLGATRAERHEAFWDGVGALALPMLAILPLGYLLISWAARGALRPLVRLQAEIAQRSGGRLDPIDAAGQSAELAAISGALNRFMIRLSQAIDAERAFATSAAHELRTPVAVALAQVQRLRAETQAPEPRTAQDQPRAAQDQTRAALDRVEAALQRMARLVARLLQLARAEAGIGGTQAQHDAGALLRVVLEEVARDAGRAARLHCALPEGAVPTTLDADAFGIVASNLIDNAFQHAPEGAPVRVTLSAEGVLSVANPAPVLSVAELEGLTQRGRRGPARSEGFGLGLNICDMIARQSGGRLELRSGAAPDGDAGGDGGGDGGQFEAVFTLPRPMA